jgi:hypothetical protein
VVVATRRQMFSDIGWIIGPSIGCIQNHFNVHKKISDVDKEHNAFFASKVATCITQLITSKDLFSFTSEVNYKI